MMDIIIFTVVLAVIAVLAFTLISKLSLRHDVASAKVVASKTISDLQKRDGAAARTLGDKDFQSKNSSADLTALFKKIERATLKQPSVDRQTYYKDKQGKIVFFIYRYDTLKVPFFVRVGVSQENGTWLLSSITGNADETKLIVN